MTGIDFLSQQDPSHSLLDYLPCTECVTFSNSHSWNQRRALFRNAVEFYARSAEHLWNFPATDLLLMEIPEIVEQLSSHQTFTSTAVQLIP